MANSTYIPRRYDKVCERCGREFVARRPEARFCGAECRDAAKYQRPESKARKVKASKAWLQRQRHVCEWCGHEFSGYPKRWCSAECKSAERYRNHSSPVNWSCPVPPRRRCDWCARWYYDNGKPHCSVECGAHLYDLARRQRFWLIEWRHCTTCDEVFPRAVHHAKSTMCRSCTIRARRAKDKARRRGATTCGEAFTVQEIGERDGWLCHLCGDPVVNREYNFGSLDPTIDHLVPVADGGEHTRANVKLAHMICNAKRQTGGNVQLQLIG